MTGTITKRARKGSKPSWGYYFLAGKDAIGKRLQFTKSGFDTKGEASDALRAAILDFETRRNARPAPVAPTLATFFERWMAEHATRTCSPKTVERYRELGAYAIRELLEVEGKPIPAGAVRLDAFGPLQCQVLINALRDHGGTKIPAFPAGRPLSPKTVRNIAGVVHSCFEKAALWQLIARNPMDGIVLPKPEKKPPRVVERDAATKLLGCARGTRLYPFILLSLATGARRGELLSLLWPDIDFAAGVMQISKSLEQTRAGLRVKGTKSERPRKFSVPAAALHALTEHRAEQDRDRRLFGESYTDRQLVFCQPSGDYYSPHRISNRVAELMKKAGITGVGLHGLRHTHASELLSQGVPITAVSKRLGHANPNVTMLIYAHALDADDAAAAKTWDDAMRSVVGDSETPDYGSLAKSSADGIEKPEDVANRITYINSVWWTERDSNPRPPRCERGALPAELSAHSG